MGACGPLAVDALYGPGVGAVSGVCARPHRRSGASRSPHCVRQSGSFRLSRHEQARDLAHHALRGLAGFASALKVKYEDIEVGLDFEPEPGLADNGDLEHDLQALLEAAGEAAAKGGTALARFGRWVGPSRPRKDCSTRKTHSTTS